jgi:hypothetical protein
VGRSRAFWLKLSPMWLIALTPSPIISLSACVV